MMHYESARSTARRRAGVSLQNAFIGFSLLTAGLLVGAAITRPSSAWAEARGTVPLEHFKSGGQLSLPLLQEIATTLHQIDARLTRMETIAKQMQSKRTAGLTP